MKKFLKAIGVASSLAYLVMLIHYHKNVKPFQEETSFPSGWSLISLLKRKKKYVVLNLEKREE